MRVGVAGGVAAVTAYGEVSFEYEYESECVCGCV